MSSVWAATNVIVAKPFALKFLKRPASRIPDRFRRFIEEARATISHRNVVRIYDLLYLDGDMPFLVMELLSGVTLRKEIRRKGPLRLDDACSVVCPVISALGSAHADGIIHCDLKSENIFLAMEDEEVVVKVLDFGLAKQIAMVSEEADDPSVDPARDRLRAPFGTIGYAAPEQVDGRDVDQRADIWALGVVLYESLCGERPFPGDTWETYLTACEGGFRSTRLAAHSAPRWRATLRLPRNILALLERMLMLDPSLRPSLKEVQRTLQKYTSTRCAPFGEPSSSSRNEPVVADESTASGDQPLQAPQPVAALHSPIVDVNEGEEQRKIVFLPKRQSRGRMFRMAALGAATAVSAAAAYILVGTQATALSTGIEVSSSESVTVEPTRGSSSTKLIYIIDDINKFQHHLPIHVEACAEPLGDCDRFEINGSGLCEPSAKGQTICDAQGRKVIITSTYVGIIPVRNTTLKIQDKHRVDVQAERRGPSIEIKGETAVNTFVVRPP